MIPLKFPKICEKSRKRYRKSKHNTVKGRMCGPYVLLPYKKCNDMVKGRMLAFTSLYHIIFCKFMALRYLFEIANSVINRDRAT